MATVFLLSAVFHEYILVVGMGFFYPVLFVMFAGAGCEYIQRAVSFQYAWRRFLVHACVVGESFRHD